IAFENVDYAQPIRVDSSSYRLAVNAGTYNYIVLFWVGNSISKLSDLVELGVYKNPQSSDQPGTIRVADGESRDDVDIFVDFNTINFK
ncbi:hypothetical protein JW960_22770, partial [candidate division KSB1 bacterium]|nr:hypothetical protein [candidate division KSB1 bacterium]